VPETDEGLLAVLERPLSDYTGAVFPLNELRAERSYCVTNLDANERKTLHGRELMEQELEVRLPEQPDSALLTYHLL